MPHRPTPSQHTSDLSLIRRRPLAVALVAASALLAPWLAVTALHATPRRDAQPTARPTPTPKDSSAAPGDVATGKRLLASAMCAPKGARDCPGAALPTAKVEDIQPKSRSFGGMVDLAKRNRGHVTVIALWASWCPSCLSQLQHFGRLQAQLRRDHVDVNFVVINTSNAWGSRTNMTEKSPLQTYNDAKKTNLFARLGGHKDDLFVFGKDGKLAIHLRGHGAIDVNQRRPTGRTNLASIVRAVR